MSTSLMPEPRQRYHINNGAVAAGCKLYTYAAGTSTPKATYTDSAGLVPHANPITLDAKGEAVIYWDGAYKVDLKTETGAQITGYPVDNVTSSNVGSDTLRSDLAASSGAGLMGWIRNAASAVATTVAKWFERREVSVFDFMTDAQVDQVQARTSTLDLTTAVQNAITAVGIRASGGKLLFPAGLYSVTNLTVGSKNVHLVGEGMGLLFDSGATKLLQRPSSTGSVITIQLAADSGAISDIEINGQKASQSAANDGVSWDANATSVETNWSLTRVKAINCKGTGFNQGLFRRGMRFVKCFAFDNSVDGIQLGGSDNLVDGCIIGNNGRSGVRSNNWTNRVVNSDVFGNTDSGIFLGSGGYRFNAFIGNRLDRNGGSDIFFSPGSGVGDDIPASACQVIGNACHNSQLTGVAASPSFSLGLNNSVITGNSFGPNTDGTTNNSNYSMFQPSGVSGNDISGNTAMPLSNNSGLLNYAGVFPESVIGKAVMFSGTKIGFYSTAPVTKQVITGSRGGNAALADLLTKLAATGLITDSTSA